MSNSMGDESSRREFLDDWKEAIWRIEDKRRSLIVRDCVELIASIVSSSTSSEAIAFLYKPLEIGRTNKVYRRKEIWQEKKGLRERIHKALGMYNSWLNLL